MNEIPEMISTIDLYNLQNLFELNFNVSKLAYHFSNETNNPIIKDIITRICHMHSEQCKKIKQLVMDSLDG